jgi:hypothetical protein
MRRYTVLLACVVLLIIAGLLVRPRAIPSGQADFTPTSYNYFPLIFKPPPTPTPTITPTPTATPTEEPCQVNVLDWTKRDKWIDILFEVKGADMIVSFQITYRYRYGSQTTTRFARNRNLKKGRRWYSYNENLSTAWQPVAVDIMYEECVD